MPKFTRDEFIAGLRSLAQWYEDHPDVTELPGYTVFSVTLWPKWYHTNEEDNKKEAEAIRNRLGDIAKELRTFKKVVTDYDFIVKKKFGPVTLSYSAQRELICTKRVVGTRKEIVDVYPTTIQPAKIEKEVEVIEWDCPPALMGGGADEAGTAKDVGFGE